MVKECALADVQETKPHHQIYINRVGIKDVKMPFTIRQKQGGYQNTVGYFSLYVDLPKEKRGTHMSRFVMELQKYLNMPINSEVLQDMNKRLCDVLESAKSFIDMRFDYFLFKEAPVSKHQGMLDYRCCFSTSYDKEKDDYDFRITVNVPVTSLCPCSKEISKYGAHNQRSNVTVNVVVDVNKPYAWIEDLIDVVESSASSPIYSVLKRPDEKYVTEQAYENPVFCEDIVRNVAHKLEKFDNILGYHIVSENHESIHNHIASAEVDKNWLRIT